MASSGTTTDGSSLQTTKQMLDELDALMERMLALPVNDPDDAPADRPAALAASLTLLDPPAVAPAPDPSPAPPMLKVPTEPAKAESPVVVAIQLAPPVRMPVERPAAITDRVLPSTVMPQLRTLLSEGPDRTPPPAAWSLGPLLLLNHGFDAVVGGLGAPGRWLGTPGGRVALGAAGLLLWGLALGWLVADALGWPW